jgi:hypothetical protein
MKPFLFILIFTYFITSNLYARSLKDLTSQKFKGLASQRIDQIKSDKLNQYVSNLEKSIPDLIPGKGLTEVSIQLRENHEPDLSILAVRELNRTENGNTFLQFSLFNTERQQKEIGIFNFGLGKRFLSNDKHLMTGFNSFLDYDTHGNIRGSIGGEVKNSVLGFNTNYYLAIHDGRDDEKVLDGYDIELTSQVPHLHWANVFFNHYKWYGVERNDIEGKKYGSEISLLPSLNLEVVYDDKPKDLDEYYVKFNFVYPPRQNKPTVLDGISGIKWQEEKDMTDQLLTKVKRENVIVVEMSGAATISRLD